MSKTTKRRPLLAANWKMYKTVYQSLAFGKALIHRPEIGDILAGMDVVMCPTLPALFALKQQLSGTAVKVGAQTLDLGQEGANTGAVSAFLIREAGADYVILGHSERRTLYGEDDALVSQKTVEAFKAHLHPIVCVGERFDERRQGQTDAVIERQVSPIVQAVQHFSDAPLVIAYEPLWAIGSGEVPTAFEANRVASAIRSVVRRVAPHLDQSLRILYGGSVKRDTVAGFAQETELDGVLVGGSSLDVNHWWDLIRLWNEVML